MQYPVLARGMKKTFLLFDPFTIPVEILKRPLKDSYRNCKGIKQQKSFFSYLSLTLDIAYKDNPLKMGRVFALKIAEKNFGDNQTVGT